MKRVLRFFRLAEYGGDELFIGLLAFSGLASALCAWGNQWLALLTLPPFGIMLWFFRDPNRSISVAPDVFLAPADGTVTDIMEVDEPEFIQGRALRLGIFLSPFNVHVNRVPCSGLARLVKYQAGEFLPAYNPEAPTRNESVALGIETPNGLRILIKQISGVLARRIVCEVQPGETLAIGQRYGMIKFGSRTELYVPISAQITPLVSVGTKVKGGLSPFCRVAVSAQE
ncbi:MAG: phosphatidylserine decarboxylase [Planctomycetota bacterium]